MNSELLKGLLSNTMLLLALSVLYSIMPLNTVKYIKIRKAIMGFLLGIVAIAILSNPFQFAPGIQFDTREVLLSITGMFLGFIPTAVCAFIASAYRLYIGGIGALPGVLSIFFSGALGLLFHKYYFPKILAHKKNGIKELLILGLGVSLTHILTTFLIPQDAKLMLFKNLFLPVFTIFPTAIILLGQLMLNQHNQLLTYISLAESENRYRSLFEKNHAIVLLINPIDGVINDANPAACKYYGWNEAELKSMTIYDIDVNSDLVIKSHIDVKGPQLLRFHFKHRLASREIRDVEVYTCPIVIKNQRLIYAIIHDITEQMIALKKLTESEERYKVTLLSVGDGVITTDKAGNITMINRVCEDISGWKEEEVIGLPIKKVFNIINEYSRHPVEDPVEKVLSTGKVVGLANHTLLICKDGTEKPIADSAAPIKDDTGDIKGTVLVFRDATEEKRTQQKITYMGYHDSLTDLYNRRFFDEELRRTNKIENLPITIIIGDVNGLKLVNDAFGHLEGDKLLKQMARAIEKSCRKGDIIARWGGDEFIVLLHNTNSKEAKAICEKIKHNCSQVNISGTECSISLGHETKIHSSQNINAIMIKAEDMMYRNKLIERQSRKANTINMILTTLHEKNPREQSHSNRVSKLCAEIGVEMGLSDKMINELSLAGLMHDIGKIAINDSILNKIEPLTPEEWNDIKRHPEIGYRILNASQNMSHIADFVLAHHERLDGSGYPKGIKDNEIPIQSKILAVADAYDAMTSDRPYRKSIPILTAISILERDAGSKFDPVVVDILLKIINKKHRRK
ncbi:diguanylate cyclase [Clostridium sp. 'deep sea']|uniref:HD domain-containing phosphohydrolase n=1 Tax=Clostridium sp. 'deep sea' TaxID=2779445 RepID=UPI0018969D58|nr:HD domain-containing phosphohydrolase [Clostridium sp. 'deep sea']QOR34303.1 diguanylate cyclase [Clostridium sp. 'deep sea']